MFFAGHLPTKHFNWGEWRKMRVWSHVGERAPDGFSRTLHRGKPIVVYCPPINRGEVGYAVRPIVRVKMGRRVVSAEKQSLYEWWAERMTPNNFSKLMAIR